MADYVPVSVYMGIGLVVSLGKMLKRCFSEAFFKKVDPSYLGKRFCWHPTLPDRAQPLCRALQPELPLVCRGFVFAKWIRKESNDQDHILNPR